jgi:predicted DNA-binding protein
MVAKEKFTTVRISIEQNDKLKELARKEMRTKLGELYYLIDERIKELAEKDSKIRHSVEEDDAREWRYHITKIKEFQDKYPDKQSNTRPKKGI